MSRIIKKNLPCLDTIDCGSSDARQVYEEGSSFCFSCSKFFPKQDKENFETTETVSYLTKAKEKTVEDVEASLKSVLDLPFRGFKERKISKEVCEFFRVRVAYNAEGEISTHYYPYEGDKAFKVRELPKVFKWISKSDDLFGKDKFNSGGKRVMIVEGEIDTLTVAQMSMDKYQKIYPVVGMSSSVMTKSLIANREWLRSFGEIILCLDNDEAGKIATESALKILGSDKVKLCKLPLKDPNEVYMKLGSNTLLQCMYDAAPYIPSGIINKEDLWEALVAYQNTPSVPYPACIGSINAKTKGYRLGEIALFVSGTSCGKSTIMREIMINTKEVTDSKVGVVSLEEAPAETARKLSGMILKRNPANEEIPLEELKVGFDEVFKDDRFVLLDHQGSLKDESILDKLEYMAQIGCKYIIIDHITILVSEGAGDLSGNEAIDKIMNDLLRFAKRNNVWVGLVSHLRKTTSGGKAFEEGRMPNLDDIKGSGSIKQISFDIIAFARNLMEPDEVKRNTIQIAVLKCRFTGLTGGVEGSYYDFQEGRFKPVSEAPVEDFTEIG